MRRLVCVMSMVSVAKIFKEEKLQVLTEDAKTRSRQNCSGWIRSSMMFQVASWTFAEYLAAIRHDDFFASVERCLRPSTATPGTAGTPTKDRELMVKHKHFIAGGSARAMFAESSKDAVKLLERALATCSNYITMLECIVGGSSPNMTNSLIAFYDIGDSESRFETCIVSALAVKMLAVRVGPKVIVNFARILTVNAAMDGHLMEAWVLASVVAGSLSYKLRGLPEVTGHWGTQQVVFFDPATAMIPDPGRWYLSTKWNRGGYDAVYMEWYTGTSETATASGDPPRMRIVFLQMTRSKKHAYAPEPFCSVLHMLGQNKGYVGSVELWFVVPEEILSAFNCPVDQITFKRQVVENAFPDATAQVDCEVRVAGVEYRMRDDYAAP